MSHPETEPSRTVWMNGELVDGARATVPLLSHGFSRGSGIFETFGVHVSPSGPVAFRLDKHLERLRRSAELLRMELAWDDDAITRAVADTVRANGVGRGLVKVMAYWGGEAVVSMVPDAPLDLAVFAVPAGGAVKVDDTTPISACLSTWRKLHPETVPVEAKACGNYLNGYLARRDARDRGFDIGIMLGTDGLLAEGSTESVFLVQDGVLRTPRTGRVLRSISRLTVLEMAAATGMPAQETDLGPEDLASATEMFTAHSGVKVHPIGRFEDRDLDAPGPVTAALIRLVDDCLRFRDDRFAGYFQPLA